MNKIIILSLLFSIAYANNTELFNSAMQVGQKNKIQLNLNQNSTIDSYGKDHAFTDEVAHNANQGTANARNMYDSQQDNPNYLYNSGVADIRSCVNKTDARAVPPSINTATRIRKRRYRLIRKDYQPNTLLISRLIQLIKLVL